MNTRYFPEFEPNNEDMYITLATRRDQVDFINEKKLSELPGEEFISAGRIDGDFPESSLPTQLNLAIKEQAQVIFIDNDYERRWVNGTIGMISGIDENGNVYVLLENGTNIWWNLLRGVIINISITKRKTDRGGDCRYFRTNCRSVLLGQLPCIKPGTYV